MRRTAAAITGVVDFVRFDRVCFEDIDARKYPRRQAKCSGENLAIERKV